MKAALETSVRYMAADLAPRPIRAFAISAGAIRTRAASGLDRIDDLLDRVRARTPSGLLFGIEDLGRIAAFLASEAAAPISGSVGHADNEAHTVV